MIIKTLGQRDTAMYSLLPLKHVPILSVAAANCNPGDPQTFIADVRQFEMAPTIRNGAHWVSFQEMSFQENVQGGCLLQLERVVCWRCASRSRHSVVRVFELIKNIPRHALHEKDLQRQFGLGLFKKTMWRRSSGQQPGTKSGSRPGSKLLVNRSPAARQPVIVFLGSVYIGFYNVVLCVAPCAVWTS